MRRRRMPSGWRSSTRMCRRRRRRHLGRRRATRSRRARSVSAAHWQPSAACPRWRCPAVAGRGMRWQCSAFVPTPATSFEVSGQLGARSCRRRPSFEHRSWHATLCRSTLDLPSHRCRLHRCWRIRTTWQRSPCELLARLAALVASAAVLTPQSSTRARLRRAAASAAGLCGSLWTSSRESSRASSEGSPGARPSARTSPHAVESLRTLRPALWPRACCRWPGGLWPTAS
mmetsp:Transcript_119716/g.298589  ORF Transcript_119716/g.298589 Transcript_119716/m.298589 type:complete len:230 (-) Transcript_119716:323-1012(-)